MTGKELLDHLSKYQAIKNNSLENQLGDAGLVTFGQRLIQGP
jgi:hypothetical protein